MAEVDHAARTRGRQMQVLVIMIIIITIMIITTTTIMVLARPGDLDHVLAVGILLETDLEAKIMRVKGQVILMVLLVDPLVHAGLVAKASPLKATNANIPHRMVPNVIDRAVRVLQKWETIMKRGRHLLPGDLPLAHRQGVPSAPLVGVGLVGARTMTRHLHL